MQTLRDVARNAVRDEVMRCAWDLFGSQGFEATTVDQIAAKAGMSRRTFFRYFAGKDELMLQRLVEAGSEVTEALAERPLSESPWIALRRAFDITVERQELGPEISRSVNRMLRDEPAARAPMEERRRQWLALIVPATRDRITGPDAHLRALGIASAALSCLDSAQDAWLDTPDATLSHLLDVVMGAVAPLS
jgi:AcrR family transcriptional regulator